MFRTSACVVALAVALRIVLLQLDLYRSTDFEVHRNWLAITHSLPLSRWYFEDTSHWTLDYPPVFAYFEWVLSQAAAFVDSAMLQINNLEYASHATVIFQRISVIAGDVVLLLGVVRSCSTTHGRLQHVIPLALTLVLLNPALLIVDHIHFQYNGMLLGVMLLSAAEIEAGNIYRGAFLFCILVNAKHIFMYVAPVYFVFLLRGHCGCSFGRGYLGVELQIKRLLVLGSVVVGTFAAVWMPVLFTRQVLQALQRLFPFGRGLTHAYWAPNIWALYNTLDRVLAKLGLGSPGSGQSSTAGMAEVFESSVLWTVPPKATFLLTALAYIPLCVIIWRQTPPSTIAAAGVKTASSAQKRMTAAFTLYVGLGCAISFTFGWHVHEKAIIMVTVPLLVAAARCQDADLCNATALLSLVATLSILPLLPSRRLETAVKWLLLGGGHAVEVCLLQRFSSPRSNHGFDWLPALSVGPFPGLAVAAIGLLVAAYCDLGGHQLVFKGRMEFLPLLIMSDFTAVLVLGSFVRIFFLVATAKNHSD